MHGQYQHAIYKRHTNSLSLLYMHAQTLSRQPVAYTKRPSPISHRSNNAQVITRKKMQPKTRFSFQERTTTWTYAVCICTVPPTAVFHFISREADRLAEQPQEQCPLEHEDGVQVRSVQREPEHRDPGSVVLQVRHCNASEDGPGRQQQF